MSEPTLPEESIFVEAIQIESAADRAAYVEQVCGNRPELKAEVESLLRAHDEQSRFVLDAPHASAASTVEMPQIAEHPGTVIGPYKLLKPSQMVGRFGQL